MGVRYALVVAVCVAVLLAGVVFVVALDDG